MCELSFHEGWEWIQSRKEQLELEQHLAKLGAAGGIPRGIPCWIQARLRLCIPGNGKGLGGSVMDGWWLQGTKQGLERSPSNGDEKCHPEARSHGVQAVLTWRFPQFLSFQVDILPPNCHLRLSPAVSGSHFTVTFFNLYFVQPWQCSQLLWPFLFPPLWPLPFPECCGHSHSQCCGHSFFYLWPFPFPGAIPFSTPVAIPIPIFVAIPVPAAIPGASPTCATSHISPFPAHAPSPGSALPSQQSPKSRAACPGIPGWDPRMRAVFWGGKYLD